MARSWIIIGALAALLAVPGVAMAQGSPQDAALDQYVEGAPGPTGETKSRDIPRGGGGSGSGSGGGGDGSGALPSGTVSALEALGSDGQAAAGLAAATAPPEPAGSRRQGSEASGEDAAPAEGRSGIGSIVGQTVGAGGEGGMGVALPLIIVAALLGAIALAAARRRRRVSRSE